MRFLASAKSSKGGIAGVVGKEATLFDDMLASEEQLNQFVNGLREELRDWRDSGYPGTAMVTRRLLEWWFERDEERKSQLKRLFFCQREAVEATIYLFEVRRRHRMPETGDLIRYALKLATGAGKTYVMALIVVWSTLHKAKVSGSSLSANFLVLVPNLTVRDRVWGTDQVTNASTGEGLDPASPDNLYDAWDMVPPEYAQLFRPNVLVKNWQSIPLEGSRDDWISKKSFSGEGRFVPASVLWAIQRRNRSDPRAAVKRFLGNWRDLVVINDEAHHVYGEKRTKAGEDPEHIKWSKIIERVKESVPISLIVDLSATPWYGTGSNKPDGTLFEWMISDFSVYDAFESGLIKVVRLPDPDEEGWRYLNLWDQISGARTKADYLTGCKGAIASMYSSWKDDFLEWERHIEGMRPGPPPVMLVVAAKHEHARWVFEHLTADYELLRNPHSDDPADWYTIQVDHKVFDSEKGKESTLREMVNTVGKPDKLGERVRCIVSVNMLSEGWNVKNVTHVLGLRAFGSPLLTEQVIGRGLRRVDMSVLNIPIGERLSNPNRPDEETVDAFGIPFVGFPVEKRKRPKIKGWKTTSTPIAVDPKKEKYAMELPNVRSWAVGVYRPLSESISIAGLPEIVIDKKTPDRIRVKPVVGSQPEEDLTLDGFRQEYPVLRSVFILSKELFENVSQEVGDILAGPTFEEVLEFVKEFVDSRVRAVGGNDKRDLGIYSWRRHALDILQTAVQGAPTDTVTVPIFGEPRLLSTRSVAEFRWPAVTAEGKKTNWSYVPCHTDLEADFARFLDSAPDVAKYVKNERLNFSVTYYEGGRARQYFPDFVVVANSGAADTTWLAETKGEIRPNTELKREAADLWCERMSRSGNGSWRHLFVQQVQFERAVAKGVQTFQELVHLLLPNVPTEAKTQPHSQPAVLRLLPTDNPNVELEKFKTLLPVYSLEAAAGYFGEGKLTELEGWIEAPGFGTLAENMFVAQARGRSMEPLISDGDYLVFRANLVGTRDGKIVLAQGPGVDPELGGPFAVKRYSSEKVRDSEFGLRRTRITLSPLNPDFEAVVFNAQDDSQEDELKIIAEYAGKLGPNS
jgi:type III restriction enzyme